MIALDIKKLNETRTSKVTEMDLLLNPSKEEKRALTDDETTNWETLNTEVISIDKQIKVLTRQNELNAVKAVHIETPNIAAKSTRPFSITKAIRQYAEGNLDGIEKEVHEDGQLNNRNIGISGGIGFHISANPEVYQRSPLDVTVTVDGGVSTVPTIKPATLIDALVAATVVDKLGVKKMLGLSGNIDLNKEKTPPVASWENENAAAPASGIKFESIPLIPRRLTTKEYISYQLLIQSSLSMDSIVTDKIIQAFARAIDKDALDKVLAVATAVTPAVAGVVDWDDAVALRTQVLANNVNSVGASYVGREEVRAKFETTAKDTGSGLFLMDGLGYPFNVSNQITNTINTSPLFFGQFNHLIMAQWGSLIVTPDAVSMAETGQWKITVNGYFDNEVEYNEAFAYIDAVAH